MEEIVLFEPNSFSILGIEVIKFTMIDETLRIYYRGEIDLLNIENRTAILNEIKSIYEIDHNDKVEFIKGD